MPKFQKKETVIDAWQFQGGPAPGVLFDESARPYVVTLDAQRCYIAPGHWVVAEPGGRGHYPVAADVFAARYEPVPEDGPPLPAQPPPAGPGSWLVLKAVLLAEEAHRGAVRDDGVLPYLRHPLEVARDAAWAADAAGPGVLDVPPAWAVAAAVLHDVLEDCKPPSAWAERIGSELGDGVLKIVWDLTNPSKLCPRLTPRAEKKAIDCTHYRDTRVGRAARLVKLLDRTHNLKDMRGPRWEGGGFRELYVKESAGLLDAILAGLRATPGHGPAHEAAFAPLVQGYLDAMSAATAPVLTPQPLPGHAGTWRGCEECGGDG